MPRWIDRLESFGRSGLAIVALSGTLAVGVLDYYSGHQISVSTIYALPIAIAAWFLGAWFAVWLAVLSVLFWMFGDMRAGQPMSGMLIIVWNGLIRFGSYALIILILSGMRDLRQSLERRVRERTAALTAQIGARERLERELLRVSEREQRRIGQDIHDSLCQHLTGTALASQVLAEKLGTKKIPEAEDAQKVVELVVDGISQSRNLAKGLNPVAIEAEGLMHALGEFAATTRDLFGVECTFECDYPVLVSDPSVATQVYRIAQEAVGNAIKHGHATEIVVRLDAREDDALLRVEDNGVGITMPPQDAGGMGLRIMAHRAKVIGASFDVRRKSRNGGTIVTCAFVPESQTEEVGYG